MRQGPTLTIQELAPKLDRFFQLAAPKVADLIQLWDGDSGTPVFTVNGRYTTRGWTEWTQGFLFGEALLLFDATDDEALLKLGREGTLDHMAHHLTHTGVHDHGFNNLSTYGNLRRLMLEGRIPHTQAEIQTCELAIRVSGAVQASRWSRIAEGGGYIQSFNGPHSLFCDTIRSCRITALAHLLGQVLMGEGDRRINLLARTIEHLQSTLKYNVYYGEGRDQYDVPGRVAHESIFNTADGQYRCPSTQQGYSPFSTWTRGQAWIISGCAEQLELLEQLDDNQMPSGTSRQEVIAALDRAAEVTTQHYLQNSAADGIPLWDTGAPNAHRLGEINAAPSDPFNDWEPFDSSAAAIAAQGFYRLGKLHATRGNQEEAGRYHQCALRIAFTLFSPPYLSESAQHQGLVLHSVYHRPNGWDHVPEGHKVPCGESSLWGDYHALELAALLQRERCQQPYFTFFKP